VKDEPIPITICSCNFKLFYEFQYITLLFYSINFILNAFYEFDDY